MFRSVEARYFLRALLVGVAAGVSAISTGSDWKAALVAGVSGLLAYAGVGAVVPAVEPSIGNKMGTTP